MNITFNKTLILASASPRRAKILKKLNIDFEIYPSSYIEPHNKTDFSYEIVESLAYNKALDVAKKHAGEQGKLILGADTIVVVDNKILGKPKDKNQAKSMLERLSCRTHFVVTSIAVINPFNFKYEIKSTVTYVTFEKLTDEQIDFYIEYYKPYDKAGAYGIQELPKGYVKSVDGELDNVIGLPSKTVLELLSKSYE